MGGAYSKNGLRMPDTRKAEQIRVLRMPVGSGLVDVGERVECASLCARRRVVVMGGMLVVERMVGVRVGVGVATNVGVRILVPVVVVVGDGIIAGAEVNVRVPAAGVIVHHHRRARQHGHGKEQ
jgi:hypothetical protein